MISGKDNFSFTMSDLVPKQLEEQIRLDGLPDLALLEIAKHLGLEDLLHFSHASARVWRLLGSKSELWSKLLKNLNVQASPRLDSLASRFSSKFPVGCAEKRRLMVYRKTQSNWRKGDISRAWTHDAYMCGARNDVLLFGRDEDSFAGNYWIWNFTVSGPKSAANWTTYLKFGCQLDHINPTEIFVFKDTICLEFFCSRPNDL